MAAWFFARVIDATTPRVLQGAPKCKPHYRIIINSY